MWFSLLLLVSLSTIKKGDAGTIISAASIALYAAQIEYTDAREECDKKHSREVILSVMYISSVCLSAASVYIFSLKKEEERKSEVIDTEINFQ